MKKFILAAAVAGVLVGCNSDDVEDALSIDLSRTEARDAAEDILDATSLLVEDILAECGIADATDVCTQDYNPAALPDFSDNDADLKITTAGQIIKLTSDDTSKYFTYDPADLQISYSSEDSLDHFLEIDISNYPMIEVYFDSHNINDDGNFDASAQMLDFDWNGTDQLSGDVSVSDSDLTCLDNVCTLN